MQRHSPENPLVVQNDLTIFVEVQHPQYEIVRGELQRFADLVKSPEYIHTYRMTSLSLWNAAASGYTAVEVLQFLTSYAKFPISYTIKSTIEQTMNKFGRLYLRESHQELQLVAEERAWLEELIGYTSMQSYFLHPTIEKIKVEESAQTTGESNGESISRLNAGEGASLWGVVVKREKRGDLKQQCMRLGYPVKDVAGYAQGEQLTLKVQDKLEHGEPFSWRPYQTEAMDAFFADGDAFGGHGVLVLPCGAGKTIIGIGCIERLQSATLILTTNTSSVRQWKRELLEKTTLTEAEVGEYTGAVKEIKPVTIATYQILTYQSEESFIHMGVFQQKNWGLIIYDEVHLLPAPIFRATAAIQSTRRLGLTATLVREDGREEDVFSLVGPKRYDVSWKHLEEQGFIAKATCTEVRVEFDPVFKEAYFHSSPRKQTRIAQENPNKLPVVQDLIHQHRQLPTLIIGQYVDQLETLGTLLNIPVITGKMKQEERDELYRQFREGHIPVLAVSKVANFAIDLPDAAVAIQISGTYGSRQEEAQRLGRILRPKSEDNEAYFYHIVTKDSRDQEYASKRQLFLMEQGYRYNRLEWQSSAEQHGGDAHVATFES
ncbi:DNA repair helicase XPB [Caldalkalibacillus salinus]|uniref:DNA repair helicase XPB n=1 Tax=Caldalkalibacillus salinus TaxID=2803787 RepID=UPI001922D2F4|nr:DNA repair helicase XPB [Caldalkalibacillus salinus]